MQVTAEAFGDLAGDPVLAKRCLNKNIGSYYKEEQRQEEPEQYFFKSLQVQWIVCTTPPELCSAM
jgi:hypothetical protein